MGKFLEHYDQLTRKMNIMEGLTIDKNNGLFIKRPNVVILCIVIFTW
jgi:hypothetical protein